MGRISFLFWNKRVIDSKYFQSRGKAKKGRAVRIFVITDNEIFFERFLEITKLSQYDQDTFDFFYSKGNQRFFEDYGETFIKPIDINEASSDFIRDYDLGISVHCKQLFPRDLVCNVRCVNIHPGYNPYNRGWFPQVFSIINKYPAGATIHEMDEKLDHGGIIVQQELEIHEWETSFDVYERIIKLEIALVQKYLKQILHKEYSVDFPINEGNVNLKKDFNTLCHIDLDKQVSYREAIDFFRAMTFHGHDNAYFYDSSGSKVFVEMAFKRETKPILPQEIKA
jgi:methionyl-tRNA formyltransferase